MRLNAYNAARTVCAIHFHAHDVGTECDYCVGMREDALKKLKVAQPMPNHCTQIDKPAYSGWAFYATKYPIKCYDLGDIINTSVGSATVYGIDPDSTGRSGTVYVTNAKQPEEIQTLIKQFRDDETAGYSTDGFDFDFVGDIDEP